MARGSCWWVASGSSHTCPHSPWCSAPWCTVTRPLRPSTASTLRSWRQRRRQRPQPVTPSGMGGSAGCRFCFFCVLDHRGAGQALGRPGPPRPQPSVLTPVPAGPGELGQGSWDPLAESWLRGRPGRELASCSFSNQSHSREWPPQGLGSLSTRISGCPLCWGPVGARGPGKKQGAEEFGVLGWKLVFMTSQACGLWPGDSLVWISEGT